MWLPIKSILWAPSNAAHHNHLHVEGDPRFTGTPPPNNPGMSPAVWTIYVALSERFGVPKYMDDDDPANNDAWDGDWTHMGWYNRRPIAGKTTWSQHAWSNALDIGPYYGVEEQQVFYDFLTGKEETVEKIPRPSWISDGVLQRLAKYNIVPRELETEDTWRNLAFDERLARGLEAQIEAASGPGLKRGDSVTLV